ncbi:MAG: hypothetical protein LDL41_16340 [Coleofasciculus sp. S288]|nr:hypothetical protein [Coleofasciculus sp. S288]
MTKKIFHICDDGITNALNQQLSRNITPCAQCGSKERKLGAGKEPHSASLRCGECDRFIKWVSKRELARIESQANDGRNA